MKPRRFIFFPSFQPVFEYKILRMQRAMKKQEIDAVFDEHKEIYLFFAVLRPNSVPVILRVLTIKVKIENLTKKFQFREKFIFHKDFSPCSTLQVTWIRNLSQVTTVNAICDQPSRLTKSFVEYYRFDSLLLQLYKQLGYKTYLKLLRLPLSETNLVDFLILNRITIFCNQKILNLIKPLHKIRLHKIIYVI